MNGKKKRGRKPKGGKIIQVQNHKIKPVSKENNVILHLKCSSADLKPKIVDDRLNYIPTVVEDIESYQLYTNKKLNTFSFKTIGDNTKKSKTQKAGSGSRIDEKLKNISQMLHNNDIPNKKSLCFWCTETFNNKPIFIPKNKNKKSYDAYGYFCSAECATAFLFNEKLDTSIVWERYSLLNSIYKNVYGYKEKIRPAPEPFYILDKFFGNLSIDEFRSLNKKGNNIFISDKPLTRVMPELQHDTDIEPKIHTNLLHEVNCKEYTFCLKSNRDKKTKQNIIQKTFNF